MQSDDAIANLKPLLDDVIQAGPDLSKRRLCLAAMLRETVSIMVDDRTKPVAPPETDERPDPMGLNRIRETSRPPKPQTKPPSPVPASFHAIIAVLIDVMTSWEVESTEASQKLEAEKLAEQISVFVKGQTRKLDGKIQSLREEANSLRNANKDVTQYEEQIAKLKDKSRAKVDACEKLRSEREQLKSKIVAAETEAAQIQRDIQESRKRLASLKAKRKPLEEISSEISEYEDKISNLDSELSQQQEKKKELAKHLSCTQQLVDTLDRYSSGSSAAAQQITQIWNAVPADEFDKLLQSSGLYPGQQR